MKTWILALVMMVGIAVNAQPGERRHEGRKHSREHVERFTPEQRAELQVKKMTLALDLTEKQQKDIKAFLTDRNNEREKIMAERKANREAGKKPTSDERFVMKSKMLDDKIATKAFFKKTLDAKQLARLDEMKSEKREKITKGDKKFKKTGRR
jgi:protein CpxP